MNDLTKNILLWVAIVLILLLFAAYSFSKADPKQAARVLRYIGGGAVHYAEHPRIHHVAKPMVRKVAGRQARRTVTTTTTCTPGTVTLASAAAPVPFEAPAYGGGAVAPMPARRLAARTVESTARLRPPGRESD